MNSQIPPPGGPITVLRPGLQRAKVHSQCHQRVVFAVDGSGSMLGAKAHDACEAFKACCQELALPVNKGAFEVAVVRFGDDAALLEPLGSVQGLLRRLDKVEAAIQGGSTNMAAALELAAKLLAEAEASPPGATPCYVRPLTVVLSDGQHNTGGDPVAAAQQLKRLSDVLCVGFGNDADTAMLDRIATEQLSVRCRTGQDLRCYFAQVGRTLTVTRASGQTASAGLAAAQQ
jgi:uncharacterized protein YegL